MSLTFDELFPGRFLKSGQFKGKDVTLTIRSIRLEELPDDKGGKKVKGIIGFTETPLELVLNRTNGESFKALWGRDTSNWVGKRITLWPAPYTDNSTGEVSTAIRVRGSPDLEKNISFELKLARKKSATVTLLKTGGKNGKAPQPAPESAPRRLEIKDADEGEGMPA